MKIEGTAAEMRLFFRTLTKGNEIMSALDDLTREVAEAKTVNQSAVALLQGLKQRLDEAGTDQAKLEALSASLDAETNALAKAVTDNTPAETPVVDPGQPIP